MSANNSPLGSVSFMANMTSTVLYSGGVILTNLGLLKTINSISSIVLGAISAVQGMGISSNEDKEGIREDDKIGRRVTERGWNVVKRDALDIPKAVAVAAIGFTALVAGLALGGNSFDSILPKGFVQNLFNN